MRAATYHRTSPADAVPAEAAVRRLRVAAEDRGWDVVLELTDQVADRRDPWPARRQLAEAIERGSVHAVLVESLHRIARTPWDLIDVVGSWIAAGVHLVAVDHPPGTLPVDTTAPAGALRLRDALDLLRTMRRQAHAESCQIARALAASPPADGRPRVIVHSRELAACYHAGLSIRETIRRLAHRGAPASYGTVQAHLATLRAQGELDETLRRRAIDQRGGLPRGGRPRKRRR